MPSSKVNGKNRIKGFIESKPIRIILDIGAGSATYPKLLGNCYRWRAVEIFKNYVKKFDLKNFYEQIVIGDACDVDLPYADSIILRDGLDDMEQKKALNLLKTSIENYRHVIVSIPIGKSRGKVHYGNIYEKHISTWKLNEIKKLCKWELIFETGGLGVFCK